MKLRGQRSPPLGRDIGGDLATGVGASRMARTRLASLWTGPRPFPDLRLSGHGSARFPAPRSARSLAVLERGPGPPACVMRPDPP